MLYEDDSAIAEEPVVAETADETIKPDLTPAIDRFFKRFRI